MQAYSEDPGLQCVSRMKLLNEKNDRNTKVSLSLSELINRLHDAFATDHVNIDYVKDLMASYRSNPLEWKKYAKFDRYRYTRNLVDEGNGRFNLMVLCWGEGHGSAIHDHANAHCVMKILQGELCETRYAWPTKCKNQTEEPEELKELERNTVGLNEICYINDSLGLHRVENPSTVNPAVSLHLYSPPFSTCSVFNKQTGQKSTSKVTFWSKFGEKRNREIQDSRCPEDN
ncbi:cysteine dioxygenase type 1-like isoform X2 [Ceratina calcarata]|uniref:Cysteine dioxygenase n=1 Tax=Ceratina calcarata TaxID=156304 RepID=A0AAJ7IS11_9HYME|nr:cysteine dioxygenase type 1-like isoform X2 [Ceratina calcarata]XP_017875249.1 cysteine dioxygenase type 1-like isoform X1 [Ceratina calcarata]XP_026667024.1 cysteine dioxygenase type 1-like isoform X2 [Ceratina calcarata]